MLKDKLLKLASPYYKNNDDAHKLDHILNVLNEAEKMYTWAIKTKYGVSEDDYVNIVTAAILHDIGVQKDRKLHHIYGYAWVIDNRKKLLAVDPSIDIEIVAKAVKEHRASYEGDYFSIVSMIISAADRGKPYADFSMHLRSYQYAIGHGSPDPVKHSVEHVKEKFGTGGYSYKNGNKFYFDYYKDLIIKSQRFVDRVTIKDFKNYLASQNLQYEY